MSKTVQLPELPVTEGRVLFRSLNNFWRTMYEDKDVIKTYCYGSGEVAAQGFLNFLETVNSLSREDIPVFHRERWLPVVIKLSERNISKGIVMGQTPGLVVGPQPEDTAYQPSRVYAVGENAFVSGSVTYKVNTSNPLAGGIDRIVEQIVDPEITLVKGVDYEVNGSEIVFTDAADPFSNDKFLRRDTPNGDQEILIWGTDALFDWEFIYDNFGYAVALEQKSSEYYKNVVNSVWDLRFKGSNLATLRSAIGEMLDIPTIKSDGELVEVIYTESDGTLTLVTNKHVYNYNAGSELVDSVVVGARLNAGDFVTTTVKLVQRLSPDKFYARNGMTLDDFIFEVPSLFIPKGVVGNYGGDSGITVNWADEDLTFEGVDVNGNFRYKFPITAASENVDLFWENMWARAEAGNVDLTDFFSEYIFDPGPYTATGRVAGTINPMEFFMKNFLKDNVGMLLVDFTTLPDNIKSLDVLSRLNNLIAAHSLLLILGEQSVEDSAYQLEDNAAESLDTPYGKALKEQYTTAKEGGLTFTWVKV